MKSASYIKIQIRNNSWLSDSDKNDLIHGEFSLDLALIRKKKHLKSIYSTTLGAMFALIGLSVILITMLLNFTVHPSVFIALLLPALLSAYLLRKCIYLLKKQRFIAEVQSQV